MAFQVLGFTDARLKEGPALPRTRTVPPPPA